MFNGKEKRRELINELRSTHALQNAQIAIKKHKKNTLQQKQRQEKLFKQQVSKMSIFPFVSRENFSEFVCVRETL